MIQVYYKTIQDAYSARFKVAVVCNILQECFYTDQAFRLIERAPGSFPWASVGVCTAHSNKSNEQCGLQVFQAKEGTTDDKTCLQTTVTFFIDA